MVCKKCSTTPVIKLSNSNISLCKSCFVRYFEKKVFKTIRTYNLIEDNDHLGVAVSGGKDSTTLLYLLNKLIKDRKDIKLTGIAIDEGIEGYRDKSLEFLKSFCDKNKVNLKIFSYKDAFGKSLDSILKSNKSIIPCSVCGVFRRYLLNKNSKELGFTKLATGHNLDDEAQTVLMNYFRRNIKVSARLGPITGVMNNSKFIKRIKPLYFMTEKEVTTYAYLKGFVDKYMECPNDSDSYRAQVRDMLNGFEAKYPGTKHSIITSFLEILPLLKNNIEYKDVIKNCSICNEPCSQDICQACKYVESLVKN
ncbi:MAG TPA: TIGR00269 family protein [Candidatus Nanoarchaeia archaeon]|nr:TIGR00269 family protein [Candidatus Nanoarchaeia archaeon]